MSRAAIPASIERTVADVVARWLGAELDGRTRLLAVDELAAAEAEAARRGASLLTSLLHRCYLGARLGGSEVAFNFGDRGGGARLQAALAFGAVTARVLAPDLRKSNIEFVSATLDLGIGLVDSLCDADADAETGGILLKLIQAHDLLATARRKRARGWLRATVPPSLRERSDRCLHRRGRRDFLRGLSGRGVTSGLGISGTRRRRSAESMTKVRLQRRPAMRGKLDIGLLYQRARHRFPATIDGVKPRPLPACCPMTVGELLADPARKSPQHLRRRGV